MNTAYQLQLNLFSRLTYQEKLQVKTLGPLQPDLQIRQKYTGHTHRFSATWYSKTKWLCGCPIQNAPSCFPCLVLGNKTVWTQAGVTDLKNLNEKV